MVSALRSRFLVALASVVVVGGVAGALSALLLFGGESLPAPAADAEVVNGPNGEPLTVFQEADEHITFPAELQSLDILMEKIAIGPDGDVWIPAFSGGETGHLLYHYDPGSSTVAKYGLPDRPGSHISSAIGVTPSGQPVLAYGGIVAILDMDTASFTTYDLPVESQPGAAGTQVTDIAIDSGGVAYVARENTDAVAVVDLSTGATSSIAVEGLTGKIFDVEILGDDLYIAHWIQGGDIYDGGTGGTGIMRIARSGSNENLEGSSWALATDGHRVHSLDLHGSIRTYDTGTLTGTLQVHAPQAANIGSLAVDPETGDTWVAGRGSTSIIRWSPGAGETAYDLPVYWLDGTFLSCPPKADCSGGPMPTVIGELAVAPGGDLYFTDTTIQRIGVIHAGR